MQYNQTRCVCCRPPEGYIERLDKRGRSAAGCFQVSTNWLTKGIGSTRRQQLQVSVNAGG